MAKKQKSFAEKVVKHGGKEMVHVKYVKSVASNKEGYWRFNESMISMEKGESLVTTLKRMEDEANLTDIEMSPAVEVAEEIPEVVIESTEAVADEASIEEATEETPSEAATEAAVEETAVETVEDESVEDSSREKGEEQVEEVTEKTPVEEAAKAVVEETPEAESTEEKSE